MKRVGVNGPVCSFSRLLARLTCEILHVRLPGLLMRQEQRSSPSQVLVKL